MTVRPKDWLGTFHTIVSLECYVTSLTWLKIGRYDFQTLRHWAYVSKHIFTFPRNGCMDVMMLFILFFAYIAV